MAGAVSDKEKVNAIFRDLRDAGYFAEQNVCCSSSTYKKCKREKYVFYTKEAGEVFTRNEDMVFSIPMYWRGISLEIIEIIKKNGLMATWEGKRTNAICITKEEILKKEGDFLKRKQDKEEKEIAV